MITSVDLHFLVFLRKSEFEGRGFVGICQVHVPDPEAVDLLPSLPSDFVVQCGTPGVATVAFC